LGLNQFLNRHLKSSQSRNKVTILVILTLSPSINLTNRETIITLIEDHHESTKTEATEVTEAIAVTVETDAEVETVVAAVEEVAEDTMVTAQKEKIGLQGKRSTRLLSTELSLLKTKDSIFT